MHKYWCAACHRYLDFLDLMDDDECPLCECEWYETMGHHGFIVEDLIGTMVETQGPVTPRLE